MRLSKFLCGLAILLTPPAYALAGDEYAIVATIAGADGGWNFAAVDPQTNRLFVARSNGVMAVDLATRKVTDLLVEGAGVHGVSPIAGTPYAISANGKSANAVLFDKLSGKVEATFATGQGPDALVVEPKTGLIVIFNGKSHDATLVNVATKSVMGAIALDGKPEVADNDGAGRVFVNIEDKNEIAVIDIGVRKVVATFALNGCDAPTGLAFDAQTGVLISACENEVAKVIDAKSGDEISSLNRSASGPTAFYSTSRRAAPSSRRRWNACGGGVAWSRRHFGSRRRENRPRRENRRGRSFDRRRLSAKRQTLAPEKGRGPKPAPGHQQSRRLSEELKSLQAASRPRMARLLDDTSTSSFWRRP